MFKVAKVNMHHLKEQFFAGKNNNAIRRQRNHVQTIYMVFIVLLFLFLIFTTILGVYHAYLILSGQTTWEHASRSNITYMKIYPTGVMPFYFGLSENVK